MDDEVCYIFTSTDVHEITDRPAKRRKISKAADVQYPWVKLFRGKEDSKYVQSRFETFQTQWIKHEVALNTLIREANGRTAESIAQFVQEVRNTDLNGRLPAGLLVGSHDQSSSDQLFMSVKSQLLSHLRFSGARLPSTQAANLKIALKNVIRQATSIDDDQEYDSGDGIASSDHLLYYDLRALSDHVRRYHIDQVLIYFEDSEAFPDVVLSELISVLHAWSDRIPFTLLFGISTSLDLFEARLSQSTVRRMQCTSFEMVNVSVEDLFRILTISISETARSLWPGAELTSMLLHSQKRHNGSNAAFIQAVKYMYMIHFFADPLSAFSTTPPHPDRRQLDAVRELPSFQAYVEVLLEDQDPKRARKLLNDDAALADMVENQLEQCQMRLSELMKCLGAIQIIQDELQNQRESQWSDLYVMALSGKLLESNLIHDLLLSAKKLPSDRMYSLLSRLDIHISGSEASGLKETLKDLKRLVRSSKNQVTPLRSEHDIRSKSLRATVVAQKVELSNDRDALSVDDLSYSSIVKRVDGLLKGYLEEKLFNLQDLPLHELLVYNAKSVHRDAFTPRPRFALERALSLPHDYLDCSCCADRLEALSATQPSTAILYQLYLETGMLINSADLWSAFYAIVGDSEAEDEDGDQQRALALFSRAIAELRYLGIIKQSSKRADHLAKILWKGL